jgi:RHS repeat-associated protein
MPNQPLAQAERARAAMKSIASGVCEDRDNRSGQITSIDAQRPRTSVLRAPAVAPLVSNISYTALNQPKAWNWNCISGNLYTPVIQTGCDSASRQFDADGRMTATEFSSYQYDPASRITSITQSLIAERTTTQTIGTETSVITELYQVPFTWTAAYDNRNRLTSFNRAGSEQSYTYDANSNRLTSIAKKVSDTDIDGIFEATDRAATTSQALNIEATSNKLLGFNQSVLTQATAANGTRRTLSNVITAVNYQLDANGNLTSDGLRQFNYGADNRLETIQITKDGEAAKITQLHNAQGQRVFKSEPQTAQTLPNEAELGTSFVDWLRRNFQWLYAQAQTNATLGTSYSYGESQIPSWAMLGEYGNGGANSTGRVEYIWLPTDDGNAIPIAMFRGNRYYKIHSDHLGTPRLVTDDTAKPVWQWSYSAFGDNKPTGILKATTNPNSAITNQPVLLNATSPGAVLNLRFPGQYADSETGLAYNMNRYYQANQGRYTQADPIGLSGGSNRFGYAEANPLSMIDPEGLAACPGGAWDQELGDFALQGAAGGFVQVANLNVKCRSKPTLTCQAKQICIGGGPMVGIGASWSLGGVIFDANSSESLSGWGGWNAAVGAGPVGGQAGLGGDGAQTSLGLNLGWKFGGAAMRCYTYGLKCQDGKCESTSQSGNTNFSPAPWSQADFLYGRAR